MLGTGIDIHKFSNSQKGLNFATLNFPEEFRLEGHSDGDAFCHAVCDAILCAIGERDIGQIFGVDRAENAGITGEQMIRDVMQIAKNKQVEIESVAVSVICNRPKLNTHRAQIIANMAKLLECTNFNFNATTSDTLGFTRRNEGVYVHAICDCSKKS